MTSTLLSLSNELPEPLLRFFEILSQQMDELEIQEYFVVGAQARDLLLHYVYNLPMNRLTRDVDVAIAVQTWEQYSQLRETLINSGQFAATPKIHHRLSFIEANLPIDLVPFGDVENPPGSIRWPPDQTIQMNTMGFHEAYQHAITIQISPQTVLKVASLPGLTLLKLIAWSDRGNQSTKDAEDIGLLMKHYLDAGNFDRMNEKYPDLFEDPDFDLDRASNRMLGRDVRLLLNTPAIYQQVVQILSQELDQQGQLKLASVLSRYERSLEGNGFEKALSMLENLYQGIIDPIL